MKRIKLCVIVPNHWSYKIGGAQYQVKFLLEKLTTKKQFDIYWLTKRCDQHFIPKGYRIISIDNTGKSGRGAPKFWDTFRLLHMLKHIKPDVIYQRVGCAYTGVAAYYATRNPCKMFWHIAHDKEVQPARKLQWLFKPRKWIDKLFLDYGIKHTDYIIAQTKQQNALLQRYYKRTPIRIISNFHPVPKEEIMKDDLHKIVWIANLKSMKQPEYFIRLARDLEDLDQNVECFMIGAPANDQGWQKRLELDIKAINCLNYLGACPLDKVNAILARATIFVNTSFLEGFPNTFIQAWMRKVPVVSLYVDPDNTLKQHNVGILAQSYENMLDAVLRLLHNPELRSTIGNNARQYAFEHHSLKNAESLINLFTQI